MVLTDCRMSLNRIEKPATIDSCVDLVAISVSMTFLEVNGDS